MKALIILHGWQSSKEKWQRVKEEIEKEACPELAEGEIEVIVPDLPGFKPETELKKAWGLDDYVEWTSEFVGDRVEEPFFLLGHSFGGRMAIKFATKYPEKLKGLILISAAGIKHRPSWWLRQIKAIASVLRKFSFLPGYEFLRKIFYKFILKKTDYLKLKGAMKETFKNIIEEDLTPFLSKIEVPTLILWGEKDKTTSLRDAFLMNEEIKNSRLETLKDIGHTPHLENPQFLAQKIKEFIK